MAFDDFVETHVYPEIGSEFVHHHDDTLPKHRFVARKVGGGAQDLTSISVYLNVIGQDGTTVISNLVCTVDGATAGRGYSTLTAPQGQLLRGPSYCLCRFRMVTAGTDELTNTNKVKIRSVNP